MSSFFFSFQAIIFSVEEFDNLKFCTLMKVPIEYILLSHILQHGIYMLVWLGFFLVAIVLLIRGKISTSIFEDCRILV